MSSCTAGRSDAVQAKGVVVRLPIPEDNWDLRRVLFIPRHMVETVLTTSKDAEGTCAEAP